jgi:hypothetical protein
MPKRWLAYHVAARHGYAIERLKRDMVSEPLRDQLVDFLAYDAASFVWAYLLASGNLSCAKDRRLRDDVQAAILSALAEHGIDRRTFALLPERAGSREGG